MGKSKLILHPTELISYVKVKKLFKKTISNEKEIKQWPDRAFRVLQKRKNPKSKHSHAFRDFICSLIKEIRNKYPFVPNEKIPEYRKRYEEQLEMFKKIKIGDWITVTSKDWIYKEEEYSGFGICESFFDINITEKIKNISEYGMYANQYPCGTFRFATEEEIEKAKKQITKEIEEEIREKNEKHAKKIAELKKEIQEL